MAKSKIKKSILNMILDSYSTRPKEFESIEGLEGEYYRSKVIKGYQLWIELEEIQYLNAEGNGSGEVVKTGRILVHHSNSRGKRVFNDVWDKDSNGEYYWLCRNSPKEPFNDYRVLRDMEEELHKVKVASRKVQAENKELRDMLGGQTLESTSLKNINETNKRKAGRPKETVKQMEKAAKIRKMLEDGKTNDEIMQALNLSRPTFFRLKRMI